MEEKKLIETIKKEIKDVKSQHFFAWGILSLLGISVAVYLGGGLIFAVPSVLIGVVGHKLSTQIATRSLRKELKENLSKNETILDIKPQTKEAINSQSKEIISSVLEQKKVTETPTSVAQATLEETSQVSAAAYGLEILEEVARRR